MPRCGELGDAERVDIKLDGFQFCKHVFESFWSFAATFTFLFVSGWALQA